MTFYIDSHQHFWKLSRGDYGWLTPDLSILYRNYLPPDLTPHLNQLGIQGTIVVQAAPTIEETFYLLELAKHHSFILGVVGWVDINTKNAPALIAKLMEDPKFCGIRPMIQEIPDLNWMLQKGLTPSLRTLVSHGGTFDALVLPKHIPNLICLLENHPDLKVVINHGAKPPIKQGLFEPWATQIQQLAAFPKVYCKLSGLLTEAGMDWTWEQLKPYIDHLFSCFGYRRIMWGSDFPVLNLVSHYHKWHELCLRYVNKLPPAVHSAVFGEVAAEIYLNKIP